jgi:hypothetical protein
MAGAMFAFAAGLAALVLAGQVVTMWGCRHEFAQVESIVAMHSTMFARGEGLYYDLQRYPFTVSPYGPIFYTVCAGLYKLGVTPPFAGRWLSFLAFAGILALSWRLLRVYTRNRYARWFGILAIASSPLLAQWGTTGHVDMTGVFFALAAFTCYTMYAERGGGRYLVYAAVLLLAAVFTKQTMAASGAAIAVSLWRTSRRQATIFAGATACAALALAWLLNSITNGRYFDNAVTGNLFPWSWGTAWDQTRELLTAAGCLIVLAAAGFRRAVRERVPPLFVYLAFAAAVWAATAPKIGSELNYQIELMILLGLAAAWMLDRNGFSPAWFRGEVALLGLLLMTIQLTLNLLMGGRLIVRRWGYEGVRRTEMAQLEPYLRPGQGRILSVEIDPLLQVRRSMEVEPLVLTMLARFGAMDPEPVRRDLDAGAFGLVILFDDLTQNGKTVGIGVPSLPAEHLEVIRRRYRLVAHIPGPYQDGDYLYAPVKGDR